jgi:predicted XRE-type DNA-binding protein
MRNGPRSNRGKSRTGNERLVQIEEGSGNVFADLGLANPDLALAKAELVQRIRDLITKRKLTQTRAAKLLGLDQAKISALVRGQVEAYSVDRLFRFLNALGQQVEITVRPTPEHRESGTVVVI